ncbi:uncharacterized protein LOC129226651 [Uloborus diversus]|uniref:uncharacterized protein LOC129226651 n=1 Tax=Uloborus diversus TaxID=327109 RepID=UPI00240A8F52|nr:uncharacterized protein LOC129226651 [Uloborus diversus]
MDAEKIKNKRKALKCSATKFVKSLDVTLVNETNVRNLEVLYNQLIDKIDCLKVADNELLNVIEAKDIEKEVQQCEDFMENLIFYKCQITQRIAALTPPAVPPTINPANLSNSTLELSSLVHQETRSSIKLPKLTVNKFYGDHRYWLEFISQFENAIDKNSGLSKIEKLIYLKNLVGGAAAKAISGFALTESNYDAALELLKSRFGQKNLLINAHLGSLLNITPIKNTSDTNSLRKLYDKAETEIRNLESLGINSESYGNLLTPIILKVLPSELTLEFSRKNKSDNWDLKALLEFLGEEIQSRERAQSFHSPIKEKQNSTHPLQERNRGASGSKSFTRDTFRKQKSYNSSAAELLVNHTVASSKCVFCGSNLHDSVSCDSVSIEMKRDYLKRNRLCFFCFSNRHSISYCPKLKKEKGCSFCGLKSHPKTLCYRFYQNSDKTTFTSPQEESDDNVTNVSSCQTENKSQRVLLQTASVVARYNNQYRNCRLLADTAAQRSFVDRKFSRLLKLPIIRKENLTVYSFGDKSPIEKTFNVVKIRLENKEDLNLYLEIEALEIEKISAAHIPPPAVDTSIYSKHLKGLKLADTSNKDVSVSILIGADNYYDVMTGRIKRINRKLVAAASLYGWCLIGISGSPNKNSGDSFAMKVMVEENISKQLETFWQLENLGIESANDDVSCNDNKTLREFEDSIRFQDGRYVVKLPWKDNFKESLENNYEVAYERFSKLCYRFQNDHSLYSEYRRVVNNYIEQNIVERVPESSVADSPEFYLPHRAVIRDDRVSSKLRVVFDASSHKKGKFSLNDSLHIGPNLYPDLFELLLSYRKHPIAFTVDIKQAFLNVAIDESDKNVTKFFWTENPYSFSDSLEVLRFNRVLFGINSSPFLLCATIKHHLKKYSSIFPQTHELLNKFCYVDDIIGGQNTVASAYATSLECVQIFREANMPLHKWATNSAELRKLWEKNGFSTETSSNPIGQNMINYKVLGISWDADRDLFYFNVENLISLVSKGIDTKRFLLQVAGRIFDPIGFVAPYVIRLKILIQRVWEMGLLWDQEMPQVIKKPFRQWCLELKDLSLVEIPRFYHFTDSYTVDVQLHSFSDASKKAYGTVIYFRVIKTDGTITTSFITSKSRVAPLKTLSLPRLELMGALLSARLCAKVSKALKFEKSCFFHTDSSIVYHWIRGEPSCYKPFVKNRIEEIQRLTEPPKWNFCPGRDNPSDIVSRGISVRELKDSQLWWHGPPWLSQTEQFWPKIETQNVSIHDLELKSKFREVSQNEVILENREKLINIDKFSSYLKLLRVTAFVFRFIHNARNTSKNKGALETDELKLSEEYWIKETQKEAYWLEIVDLERSQKVSDSSKIRSLVPFLDPRNILRIKRRLDESEFSLDEKQPIILPKNSKFSELLILHEHTKNFHIGVTATLVMLRRKFWIAKGRQLVKKVLRKCFICRKYKSKPANEITAQLPKDRIVENPPFEICGLDFAGAILYKCDKEVKKAYFAIFTCAVTRGIHLELVSSMSTKHFLLAFRRFISRRGSCSVVYSDNAKSFKAANKDLMYFYNILQDSEFKDFISSRGINWKFIVERAPWWGGFYERLVKSVKDPLRKVLGKALLTFEELSTVLTEIEYVVNSRPLTYVTDNFSEPKPLTPLDFLQYGRKNHDYPFNFAELVNRVSTRESLLKRKQYQTTLLKHFWVKWKELYLLNLKTVHHFKSPNIHKEVKMNDVVLVEGTSKSKLLWDLGIVQETFKGRDGHIRACVVKTKKGLFRKPVQLIYPLELCE